MMDQQAQHTKELRSYWIGFLLALGLSVISFALVAGKFLPADYLLAGVFILGFVQLLVHFRFFLHINFSKSKRDDLDLLLFSTLIIVLMAGGTLVVLFNLHHRMT